MGGFCGFSQHKFASNVVERCLQFGGPEGRQLIINKMLGSTAEADALQAMMKDQYANYVVQKVGTGVNPNGRPPLSGTHPALPTDIAPPHSHPRCWRCVRRRSKICC